MKIQDQLNSTHLQAIEMNLGVHPLALESVGGGCISKAYKVKLSDGRSVFFKCHSGPTDMFAKEAAGLLELARAATLKIPRPLCWGADFIVMEWLGQGERSKDFWRSLGRDLARLHQYKGDSYGFRQDNYIGANLQPGGSSDDWAEFFWEKRLRFQWELASKRALSTPALDEGLGLLKGRLPGLLETRDNGPSLIHGDLWSGNVVVSSDGRPALVDPAVYYGHREAELGMTLLFGGFSPEFYEAYDCEWPLEDGWRDRCEIYNLYHLLNHLNLFGSSYLPQILGTLKKFV